VGSQTGDSLVFSLFVLIGNPLVVLAIMGVMVYRRRTGFHGRPDRGPDQRVFPDRGRPGIEHGP
jgi:hypothetical protein